MSLTVVRISFLLLLLFFSFPRARVFIIIELFGMPHSLYIHTRKIYYLVFYDARDPEVLMWWWGKGWGRELLPHGLKRSPRVLCVHCYTRSGVTNFEFIFTVIFYTSFYDTSPSTRAQFAVETAGIIS